MLFLEGQRDWLTRPLDWLGSGLPEWLFLGGALGVVLLQTLPKTSVLRLRALATPRRSPPNLARATHAVAAARKRIDIALGRTRARRRRATIELCRGVAAELRAGRTPAAALQSVLRDLEPSFVAELGHVAAAAQTGADIEPALRSAATRPGAEGLGYLAACWQVASTTGAGLAGVVDRLSESLAHDDAHRDEVAAHLAGPRTTAMLLSLLPALGLAMATAMGSAPVRFLFGTPVGLACLAAGLTLDVLGLWWTQRMVRRVLTTIDAE